MTDGYEVLSFNNFEFVKIAETLEMTGDNFKVINNEKSLFKNLDNSFCLVRFIILE